MGSTFIMVNLFIAVILEGFQEASAKSSSGLTSDQFRRFCEVWSRYDPTASYTLPFEKVLLVIQQIDPPLGFGAEYVPHRTLTRFAVELGMHDEGGPIVFHDATAPPKRVFQVHAERRGEN